MADLACSEFDEFAEALQGVDGRYLLTGRAACDWQLSAIELPGAFLMRGQDGAANLFQAACQPGVHSLFVPIGPAHGLTVNGVRMDAGSATWLPAGREFHMRVPGPQRWLAVMVESCAISPLEVAGDGSRAVLSPRTSIGPASHQAVAELMALSRRIFQSAGRSNAGADEAGTQGSALVEASLQVVASLQPERNERRGRPAVARKVVLDRALEVIESGWGQMVRLTELSQATGVSERTLHAAFKEQFGLSPHQYIVARRVQGIHAAILSAEPDDTVSDICGRFGVWDFGRFARTYRSLFGTTPSSMLARRRHRGQPGLRSQRI